MALLSETALEVEPVGRNPQEFPVPAEKQPVVERFVKRFDEFFSAEASERPQLDKEMHFVQICNYGAEVVKYRNNDGKVVRSLEIAKRSTTVGHCQEAYAFSILEDENGHLAVNKEIFTIRSTKVGSAIFPGAKRDFDKIDYDYLELVTPRLKPKASNLRFPG